MGYNNVIIDYWKAIVTARGGTPSVPVDMEYNAATLLLIEQAITASGGTIPARGDRGWNARHTQLLDTFAGISVSQSLNQTFVDMVSSGTWIDPGANHLSGTPTFSAGAWSLSMLGGAGTSVSDPFSGAHIIGPALTRADGLPYLTAHAWTMLVHMLEITPPALTSDLRIAAGFCSEDADSGTIEAIYAMIGYGTSTRSVGKGRVLNGSASLSFGSTSTSIRAFCATLAKFGNSTGAHGSVHSTSRALDSAGDVLVGINAGTGSDPTIVTGGWTPRPFLAVFRSSTTDTTTRALSFKARRSLFTASSVPTAFT